MTMGWRKTCRCDTGCIQFQPCKCCPWCCKECIKGIYTSCDVCAANSYLKRLRKQCNPNVCKAGKTDCTNIYKCECNCCRQKCKERDPVCTPLAPPPPPPPADSSDVQDHAAGQELLPRTEALEQENNSPPFRPNPQTIAAVIVAIIVAIILLDLCIFRFPVGRNIRDFLVRKIPFCIAFYS
ncbi:hypothetical protein, conserved [Babesia bigemina]|uniref:Uncharacterized protein n=1 Tax=Babesia bigemina TaxID=5866 RepID=A0A061BQ15_BABBI|nr:hypothetical protein, conserved [Babesia bigemina]CDR71572.1 hypothetical protein, conserved [Babesia bigemina]|eukprot:XP_012770518.1 hypothetical protein, conserved [Babesia bigemina]